MRVLYVNPFAQAISGPDESLLGLIVRLRGVVEPFVVLPPNSPHKNRYQETGATVFERPLQRIRRTLNPTRLAAYGSLFAPQTLGLAKLIKGFDIELVHTNMEVVLQSGCAARMVGVPSIYHVRGTSFASPRFVCNALVRAIDKASDQIIVISRAVADIFYARGVRTKISIIHNSLDPSQFHDLKEETISSIRQELTRGARGPLVAAVGRINPRKGLECFVKSAAIIGSVNPSARFAIIGDAADGYERRYRDTLARLAIQLGLSDRLVIAPARKQIAELMSAIDVLAVCSNNEGFGRVAIEAMAASRPVIASNVGGLPEVVEDGVTGILVPPDQPESFAKAIIHLLDDARGAREMGSRGRRRAENMFDTAINSEAILKLYERSLGRTHTTVAVGRPTQPTLVVPPHEVKIPESRVTET